MAAILHFGFFSYFGGKILVPLAGSVPGHYKMSQMKDEIVLIPIDTTITFLCRIIMEILVNKVAFIIHFVYFGGQRLEKGF